MKLSATQRDTLRAIVDRFDRAVKLMGVKLDVNREPRAGA